MRYVILQPDGTYEAGERDSFDLRWMQETVGGYIEPVRVSEEVDSYVNEEGKLQGLEVNPVATSLAREHRAIFAQDYIAGTVLYTGPVDGEGEITGLTKTTQDRIVEWCKLGSDALRLRGI